MDATRIKLDLNEFLLGVSFALDCVEMELLGVTSNHGKRVAYISLRMGEVMGFSQDELFDTAACAILHDNGLSEESLTANTKSGKEGRLYQLEKTAAHCHLGEQNIRDFPFQAASQNIIRYHHEYHDGSGTLGLSRDGIPLMARIITLADHADLLFNVGQPNPANQETVLKFLRQQESSLFDPTLVDAFTDISQHASFWLDLQDGFIDRALDRHLPTMKLDMPWQDVLNISQPFSRIIDCKSRFTLLHTKGLEEKITQMAAYYEKSATETTKLRIAANLHDIGKLAIPNSILDKPGELTAEERRRVQAHTYYTRSCLQRITGFEEITEWAANHHETLNGVGYPFGHDAGRLDFNARLLSCLDIYQALTEERPYRPAMTHDNAMAIINRYGDCGEIDPAIASDIGQVFRD